MNHERQAEQLRTEAGNHHPTEQGANRIADGNGHDPQRRLLAEPRLASLPMVVETPLGDDELGHARDLERLRGLL